MTAMGVYVLRRREPDLPRPVRAWGYPVTPAIFLAASLWMMVVVVAQRPAESLAGLASLVLGLALYGWAARPAGCAVLLDLDPSVADHVLVDAVSRHRLHLDADEPRSVLANVKAGERCGLSLLDVHREEIDPLDLLPLEESVQRDRGEGDAEEIDLRDLEPEDTRQSTSLM